MLPHLDLLCSHPFFRPAVGNRLYSHPGKGFFPSPKMADMAPRTDGVPIGRLPDDPPSHLRELGLHRRCNSVLRDNGLHTLQLQRSLWPPGVS